jgi:hypothetical protein
MRPDFAGSPISIAMTPAEWRERDARAITELRSNGTFRAYHPADLDSWVSGRAFRIGIRDEIRC